MIENYPLTWPEGWPRTPDYRRSSSKFSPKSFAVVRDQLLDELRLFRATKVVLSTNIPLRQDGLPYASFRIPTDTGVAVFFQRNGKPMVLACDKWRRIEDNVASILKTINAIRGIERWGSSELMERAFTGFTALPAPKPAAPKRAWHEVLGVAEWAHPEDVKSARSALLMKHHPDRGGSSERTTEINQAWDEYLKLKGYK